MEPEIREIYDADVARGEPENVIHAIRGGTIVKADGAGGSPAFETDYYGPDVTEAEAYADGWVAYHENRSAYDNRVYDNPYDAPGSFLLWNAWDAGWQDAFDQAGEDAAS